MIRSRKSISLKKFPTKAFPILCETDTWERPCYCLVTVDMFSKWVEVFSTSNQDASAVTKALLTKIIPRWGIPERIGTDNGNREPGLTESKWAHGIWLKTTLCIPSSQWWSSDERKRHSKEQIGKMLCWDRIVMGKIPPNCVNAYAGTSEMKS